MTTIQRTQRLSLDGGRRFVEIRKNIAKLSQQTHDTHDIYQMEGDADPKIAPQSEDFRTFLPTPTHIAIPGAICLAFLARFGLEATEVTHLLHILPKSGRLRKTKTTTQDTSAAAQTEVGKNRERCRYCSAPFTSLACSNSTSILLQIARPMFCGIYSRPLVAEAQNLDPSPFLSGQPNKLHQPR